MAEAAAADAPDNRGAGVDAGAGAGAGVAQAVKPASGAASASAAPVAAFFKGAGRGRKGRRKNIRKRERASLAEDAASGDDNDAAAAPSAVVKKAPTSRALHTFGTRSGKKQATGGVVLNDRAHKSNRDAVPQQYSGGAFAQTDVDGALPSGVKKGNKFTGIGPIRAPAHIRSTSFIDTAPDICKDWKETGFCGYGDSCKFLHDRGDYKHGWQLDREWEEKRKREQEALARGDRVGSDSEDDKYVIDSDDEEFPFACFICREAFTHPIVTQCGHFFCRGCAMKRYQQNTTCAACGKQTYGVFNVAKKLLAYQTRMAAKMASDDVDDDDGDGGGDDDDGGLAGAAGSDVDSPAVGCGAPPSSNPGFVSVT